MDSPPITSTASASPLPNSMAANIMASPPEEQAVLTVKLGPWMPYSMATWAAAMFPMTMGTNRGPIFLAAPVE